MHFRLDEIAERVPPARADERAAAAAAIRALARPRLSGSGGADAVAEELRARFEALGFRIRELPFRFSTWPGRYGLPLAGVILGATAIAATLLQLAGDAGAALVVVVGAAAVLGALGFFAGAAIDGLPWSRLRTANWLVHRPGAKPRFLIVAHRDSKSQPVSTLVRTVAVAVAVAGWILLVILVLGAAIDPALRWTPLTIGVGALLLAAAAVLALSWSGNDSPGALDNASGLAALLAIAARERDSDDVAFLVTDAEELGLAGARAVRHRLPWMEGVVNLDGLDDEGDVRVVARHGWPRRGGAPNVTAALLTVAVALDVPARRQDLPVAMLVDHVALAEIGLPCVTVMRGTLDSLRRVHRPSDTADRLDGRGAASVAAIVSGALRLLRDAGPERG